MVEKDSADWKDVTTLAELLKGGKKIKDLHLDVACMSHVKYPCTKLNSMHYKRQKYRQWLLKNALNEYKKEMNQCSLKD